LDGSPLPALASLRPVGAAAPASRVRRSTEAM
jgi:hypothetical protein